MGQATLVLARYWLAILYIIGAVWGLLLRQLMLAMLVLARLCLTLFILGSLGLPTAATYVSHACPCPLLFNFIFQYCYLIWASWALQ